MMEMDSEAGLQEIASLLQKASNMINALKKDLERKQNEVESLLEAFKGTHLKPEYINSFVKKPYTVIPRGEKEWFLIVPRFLDFQYGWLFQSDESYNVFIINRYVQWLYPIPGSLKHELRLGSPAIQATVSGSYMRTTAEQTEEAFRRYREDLLKTEAPGLIKIKKFHEFNLISSLIRDGVLPFEPQQINPEDLSAFLPSFELREYQKEAWETFLRYGNCGIYWPPGAGKMFFALYALSALKGQKLVVVPTVTLIEEWKRKIRSYVPAALQGLITITTYISANKYRDVRQPFALIVYDEHQHLPADTYARLSLIPAKYRLGLSATPFREDGRVDLIFALTGYPVGLAWDEYFKLGLIQKPTATCYIVENLVEKLRLTKRLCSEAQGKTIIFCDSIDLGHEIARTLGVPFVHGDSTNRLQTIDQNKITVVSRVGDEGLDITDLQQIIEVSFLFGSRRQELQRFGRLLHSRYKGRHIIIMTKEEYDLYKKRLLSLYEKGFQVQVKEPDSISGE